jgi:uncharacterized protein YfaS (alpha-2-macroglobulin family)
VTYPNALVMGYLKDAGQLTPEWRMKLEEALSVGVQRLLTFEVKGGGFDWYPGGTPHTLLTAYGLMELHDIDRVYALDKAWIDRTRNFLRRQQRTDGGWSISRGAYSWRTLRDEVAVTAYITWAILETGAAEPKGAAFLESHYADAVKDPYTLALVANALYLAKSPVAARAIKDLESAPLSDLEALALASLVFARSGAARAEATVSELVRAKDPTGAWRSTAATILAIKTLLDGKAAAMPERDAPVSVRVNGQPVDVEPITKDNYDVVQQVNVSGFVREGENEIEIACDRRVSVQVAARCWIPWSLVEPEPASPLTIDVAYDKARLARGETVTATATLRYSGPGTFMVIADLGVPPGFAVEEDDIQALLDQKRIDKYAITARQITLYFGAIGTGQEVRFSYRLRPRYPVSAKAPAAQAYEYYAPDKRGACKPVALEVTE